MALDEKNKSTIAKVELASLSGGYCDQLAVVATFECWKRAKDRGQEAQFYSSCCLNAQDAGILRAVLTAGMYPMVGRLLPHRKQNKRVVVETASGAKVCLHPHSLNFNLSFSKSSSSPLIIYDEVTHGDGGMYIRNCSLIG